MGLLDRLFKKKKKAPPLKPITVKQTRQETTVPRPPARRTLHVKSQRTATTRRADAEIQHKYSTSVDRGNILDPSIQRMLDESVKKISKTSPIRRAPPTAVHEKRIVKHKPVEHAIPDKLEQPIPTKTIKMPKQETEVKPQQKIMQKTMPKTTPKTTPRSTQTTKLLEDTMGEEELFKKLAQWDKDLKTRATHKKLSVQAPVQEKPVAKPPEQKPPKIPTTKEEVAKEKKIPTVEELDKREEKLRKFEAKLRDREKKVRKLEEMDKVFTDIEDTELEGFSKDEVGEEGLFQEDLAAKEARLKEMEQDILRREQELERRAEEKIIVDSEELYEPIKNLQFSNFIVGPSNRFAHDVALSVAKAPADAYNPLFIYSNVGLGKTHLLCAIGNYISSKDPSARIVYASSEKFTNELLDYLRLGEMEKFRAKYRNVDVLLVDDIQFIGGQEGTQEEFFHTFNALYNAHKQIVITSDRPPKNISHLKDRLRSRFEGGLIINIKPPDLGTRTQILHEKAERDGIYIPDEIINYVAGKVKSNVRTLIGVLNRVVAHSSLTDREMDTSLVDEVLRDVMDEKLELPE